MAIKPNYKKPFSTFVKNQHKPFQAAIEDTIQEVCNDPLIGEKKIGDLSEIYVHKFTYKKQEYLIAYRHANTAATNGGKTGNIDFYLIGPHENFYKTLKAYLKASG